MNNKIKNKIVKVAEKKCCGLSSNLPAWGVTASDKLFGGLQTLVLAFSSKKSPPAALQDAVQARMGAPGAPFGLPHGPLSLFLRQNYSKPSLPSFSPTHP
jgi:hypothetical protein